jgi:hypothetical protein
MACRAGASPSGTTNKQLKRNAENFNFYNNTNKTEKQILNYLEINKAFIFFFLLTN